MKESAVEVIQSECPSVLPSSSCKTKRELNRYLQVSAIIRSTREKGSEADAIDVRTREGILASRELHLEVH